MTNNKRALVLAGGGSKGAFQVGVLKHLLGDLQIHYDIISGISVGALNAGYLCQFYEGQEKESIESLEQVWDSIKESDVYTRHVPFGKMASLWKPSIYDSSNLKKFVSKNLDVNKVKNSGKELRICACSLITGDVKYWNEKDSNELCDAILASSAFPIFFNPVMVDGDLYTDAGVKEIAPFNSAIAAGATEIDIILTSPLGSQVWKDKKDHNVIKVLLRTLELMTDEILENDLIAIEKINKRIKEGKAEEHHKHIVVNLFKPDKILIENSLDFNKNKLSKMKQIGYEVGKNHEWNKT